MTSLLAALEADEVTLRFRDPLKPWVAEDGDRFVLLMPVRVS